MQNYCSQLKNRKVYNNARQQYTQGTIMGKNQVYLLAAIVAVFLATFLISSGFPTGLVINDELRISIDDKTTYETDALITWSTNKEALATIVVNGKSTAFAKSNAFSKTVDGLESGTKYDFIIRACDSSGCKEKTSSIKTSSSNPPVAITGAITGGEGVTQILKTSANLVLYALLGIVALAVGGRIGYEKLATRDPMPGMMQKAEKHLDNEQYSEALESYSQARQMFMKLEEDAKVKHHTQLVGIYQSLKRYSIMKEAQSLTEKYEKGDITREEMQRLSELLAS